MTRHDLERILEILRGPAPPPSADLDVYPALDEDALAALDPSDAGQAGAFVAWSQAADAAFDGETLTRPFAAHWGGVAWPIQMAFARAGLCVRVDTTDTPHGVYAQVGTLVVTADARALVSDLGRLLGAFEELRDGGAIALPCVGHTVTDGWSDVAEQEQNQHQTAVFWTSQDHDAFDAVGQLHGTLHLDWRGDAAYVAQQLRAAGLLVIAPASEGIALKVSSHRAPPQIPSFADVRGAELRPGSRPPITRVLGGGPLVVDHAFRSLERKPVTHLALSPSGGRIAIAHGSDRRGGPQRALLIVDARGANVHTAIRTDSCEGIAFVDEARLLVGWSAHVDSSEWTPLPEPATSPATPSVTGSKRRRIVAPAAARAEPSFGGAVVLELVDVSAGTARTLRCFGFSHAPRSRAAGFSHDRTLAAMPTPRGILVVKVPRADESANQVALIGAPQRVASPIVAMSPDGRFVATSALGGEHLYAIGLDGVKHVGLTPLITHSGGRAVLDLAFDPDSKFVLALCVRDRYEKRTDGSVAVFDDRTLEIFELASGARALAAVSEAARGARCFAFLPGRALLALGHDDGAITLVAFPEGTLVARVPILAAACTALAFSDEGGRFVAGDEQGRVTIARVVI